MQIIAAIYDFIDNRLSPTLVRDIRQLVRNRFIAVMLNLYLLILTLGTLMTITMQSARTLLEGSGEGLYQFDIVFFFIFAFIVVNLYTAVMMSQERITNDLMFTTTIRPSGFVFGKLSSALVLTGMLFCATLPFITIAYMLRGIDLRTIFETCVMVGLTLLFSLSATILVFSRVKTYVQMIGIMILYAMLCTVGVYNFLWGFFEYLQSRAGTVVHYSFFLLAGLFIIASSLVLLSGAISRVAATNTNRIMPFRITYTIYLLLTLGVAFFLAARSGHSYSGYIGFLPNLMLMTVFFHYFLFLGLIVISTCGRDRWGLRIKRTIPNSILLRCLCFPFYSGAVNGIVWLLGIAGVLLVSFFLALSIAGSSGAANPDTVREALLYGVTWAIMTYAFCTLAMVVRAKIFRRQLAPENTWLLALAMIGGFYSIYFTIRILLTDERERYGFYLEADSIERTMAIAMIWAVIATLLFLPWALRQLPNFSPRIGIGELTFEKAKKVIDHLLPGRNPGSDMTQDEGTTTVVDRTGEPFE